MGERVLAVIVCFNPKIEALAVALKAITEQVEHTVIVDNASHNRDDIVSLVAELPTDAQASVLPQTHNLGLGAAHNIGVRYARQNQFDQVLILDQDSVPLKGMVASLQSALRAKQTGPVAAVGATYLNTDNGSESFFVRFGWLKFRRQYCAQRDSDGCLAADFLISSGSLFPLESFSAIGSMDESLFIDHVDTEWFLRAKHKGFAAYGVCDAVMQHGLGEQTHQINFKRQRNVPQHKPFRYYYIFRNSVALYKKRGLSWLWKWNDFQRLVLISVMFGLWKRPRRQNLAMMAKGVWHGLRGVTGELKT